MLKYFKNKFGLCSIFNHYLYNLKNSSIRDVLWPTKLILQKVYKLIITSWPDISCYTPGNIMYYLIPNRYTTLNYWATMIDLIIESCVSSNYDRFFPPEGIAN